MIRSQIYGYRRARGKSPKPATHRHRSFRQSVLGSGAYTAPANLATLLAKWMLHRRVA